MCHMHCKNELKNPVAALGIVKGIREKLNKNVKASLEIFSDGAFLILMQQIPVFYRLIYQITKNNIVLSCRIH